jgi:predicted nucleotidyltransferase
MDNERLEILRLLIENREKTYSIRQISIQRKINYKSAYEGLMALEREGIVILKNLGNTTLCSFAGRFNASVFLVEDERRRDLLKDRNFQVLYNRLAKHKGQFILMLFGSFAKGQQTKGSDIDLLLISDDPKPIQTQVNLLPLKIHLTHVSYRDFDSMLRTKEFTVVSEAVKHNILLFGIEDYYRLLNNA